MPLTPEQEAFLEQYLQVPKLAGAASKKDKREAEKADAKLAKEYEDYARRSEKVRSSVKEFERAVNKAGQTKDHADALQAFQQKITEAKSLADQQPPQFKQAYETLDKVNQEAQEHTAKLTALFSKLDSARKCYHEARSKATQQFELLKVIPKAASSNVGAIIDRAAEMAQTAEANVAVGDFAKANESYGLATKELSEVAAEFKKQQGVAEKLRKDELGQWAKKPECLDRLSDVKALYSRISPLPGIDKALKDYADLIKAAETLAGQDNFVAALAKLDEIKKKKLPDENACCKASEKELASIKDSKHLKAPQAALAKLKPLVSEQEFTPLESELQSLLKRLLGPEGGKALDDLKTLTQKIDEAAAANKDLETELVGLTNSLINGKTKFDEVGSELEIANFETKFDAFTSARQAKQLAIAKQLGAQLLGEIQAAYGPQKQAYDLWMQRRDWAGKAPALITKLQVSECAPVKQRALVLMNYVAASEIKRLTKERQWTALASGLAKAAMEIPELEALNRDFVALKQDRATAGQKVKSEIAALAGNIKQFQAAVDKAAKANSAALFPAVADYQARLDTIQATWERKMQSATSEPELDLEGTLAALAAIQKDLEAAAGSGEIEKRLAANTQEKARATFEKDWESLQGEITKLQALDNQKAIQARVDAKALRDTATANYVAGVAALAKLKKTVTDGQASVSQAREKKVQKVKEIAEQVLADIKELKKNTQKARKFGAVFDALMEEQAELLLLGQSTNLDALGEAELGLRELQKRLLKFSKEDAGAGVTLDDIAKRMGEVEKEFKKLNDTLSKNCPKKLKELNESLAKLKKSTPGQDPDVSATAITNFQTACAQAKADADVVIQSRKEFDDGHPTVKQALTNFEKRKVAPEYAKSLKDRLEGAAKLAKNPNELYRANVQLKAIDEELKAAAMDAAAALSKEGQLRGKDKADKAAKIEWEKSLKLFNSKRLAEAETAMIASKGDKSLIKEVKNILSDAVDMAKKGDFAGALKHLRLAAQRVDEIILNPYGATIGSRNNLPKDAEVYKEAIGQFRNVLQGFPPQAEKAVPNLPAPVGQKLRTLIDGLSVKFDPNQFDAPIVLLGGDKISDKERRTHREAALAKVRSTHGLLESNPLLISLVKNPIAGAEFSAALRRLSSSLTRLETNISRCCK